MKKATITVNFDEEKTAALKLYLEQKGTSVPAGVREFISLRSGNGTESSTRRGKQKQREPEKPATGNPVTEEIRS